MQLAANTLQQLGIMIYFSLHDLVVINPIWLSYILSSISKFTVEDGVLMHNTLNSAWKVRKSLQTLDVDVFVGYFPGTADFVYGYIDKIRNYPSSDVGIQG